MAANLRKPKPAFLDKLRIFVRGGAGGQGHPKYAGLGGKGGDVIIRAVKRVQFKDLIEVNPTKRYTAASGANSSKKLLLGPPGEDQIIPVPVGVTVTTDTGRVIGDLNEEGQEVIAARGGEAGGPENNFNGKKGEAHSVTLDLKLIADIGLVGFPNAGKSTFLSAISRATPKIADYPFTTIRPQIGIMEYPDFRQITIADLPGLIEGAHVNFGMGHKFLKHVERTKMLLFMVDINGFQLSTQYEYRTAFETILLLNKELELFNMDLLKKPAVLALNKIDTDEDGTRTDAIVDQIMNLPDSLSEVDESLHPETLIKFDEIYKISTMFDQNTLTMKDRLRKLLDIYSYREDEQKTVVENNRLAKQERVLGVEQNRNKIV
ncbi:GTP-binding protein 10-like isoform X2 [Mercenaria mercenaria]|uniref:GTP-binding protein 10-like isoform X2 n=1 Tax=Mercenaria mercenaria TaxID=6596 RepID=UPI00234E82AC|nr:GTP-binding protein 10-like isoform X2 [Mercenaria mercenaria]